MLTLDEAIKHAEEKAREINNKALKDFSDNKTTFSEMISCRECASEHLQLAKWLKELKALRASQNKQSLLGYWTKQKTDKTHYVYICSICGGKTRFTKSLYCKDCGSRMIEEG